MFANLVLTLVFLLASFPIEPLPVDWRSLPAIVSVYDPALCLTGDPAHAINCDDDPGHFATGIAVGPEWYNVAAACDPRLLGHVVTFPAIGITAECVDTGGAIGERWSLYYGRRVVVFDVMVDLTEPAPEWSYWLLDDWIVDP